MNANEIKTFEEFWQKLWKFIYEIFGFLRDSGKDHGTIGDATTEAWWNNIK